MPRVKVPLANAVYANVDGSELSDRDYQLINGYIDELGYTVKRPGLSLALDLGEGTNKAVTGLFWWPQKSTGIAVCNSKMFKLAYSAGTLSATNITGDALAGTLPPVFAVGNNANVSTPTLYGLIANGNKIVESNGTGTTTSNFTNLADADAPTTVSHVDFVDGYVLATTGKNTFQWSDVTAPTTWSALSFASAMRNPDNAKALKVFKRQVVLLGDVTTEVWENDGTPFAPTPGGYYETGIIAPNSLVKTETSLIWLNSQRRFVEFTGADPSALQCPYNKDISNFSDPTDCTSYYVNIEGKPFVVFNFDSDNRTFVYNAVQENWLEWSYYNTTGSSDDRFMGQSYAYSPIWGKHLVGSRFDSKIYYMSPTYKDDAGNVIRIKKVTGHIDFGTNARKRSKGLTLRLKRGEGLTSGVEPVLMLRWNDDNKGWSNEHTVGLGKVGDYEIVRTVDTRGMFRTRQYEMVVTDSVGVSIGSAEEDIDILGGK